MLCPNCSKLASLPAKKNCVRCASEVGSNLAVLCENCSSNERVCSVCLKKILAPGVIAGRGKGCGCGK